MTTATLPKPITDHKPRCWRCCRVLADEVTRPWCIKCSRCTAKNAGRP